MKYNLYVSSMDCYLNKLSMPCPCIFPRFSSEMLFLNSYFYVYGQFKVANFCVVISKGQSFGFWKWLPNWPSTIFESKIISTHLIINDTFSKNQLTIRFFKLIFVYGATQELVWIPNIGIPALFLEKIVLSPTDFSNLCWKSMDYKVRVYFQTICSIPLIRVSIAISIVCACIGVALW